MSKSLFLNIGYKCNFNCVYCVIGGIKEEFLSKDFVSFEEIKKINLNGYDKVWITGGEPTIHPNIFEILDYFFEKKINIFMQSNGSILGNEEFYNKIKKYNINFQLALNSFDEKIHNTIMKNKNAFNLSLNGIKNIIKSGQKDNLTIKIILTKLNYKTLEKTIRFLNSLGIKKFYITYPVLKGNFLKYINKLVPNYTELSCYISKLILLEKELNIIYVLESFPYCIVKKLQYKNVWEIGQLNFDYINSINNKDLLKYLNLSNNCFEKYGERSENRDCNNCEIINFKENLNNISYLHKNLNKEINANCLDNLHKNKNNSCFKCKFNLICTGVSKEYISLFGFSEFNEKKVKINLSKKNILGYINYVREL